MATLSLASSRPAKRCFVSPAVEQAIESVKPLIQDPKTRQLFENCLPNTLDTTVKTTTKNGAADTYIITGDIDAMWLRDSTAQVWPYLQFIDQDEDLNRMVEGLIRRQQECVLIDPYANAFYDGATGGIWDTDLTQMRPEVHERKWEIDSLCSVLRLGFQYWTITRNTAPFQTQWLATVRAIVKTFKEQQRKTNPGSYSFMRSTPIATDTVPGRGWGNPTKPNGLIHSMFRPSDDACIYPYLIPANAFAVVELQNAVMMLEELHPSELALIEEATRLAEEVEDAINEFGIVDHPIYGTIYAYEVDGFGNALMMDDSNIPSLLSLPYLGYCLPDDLVYQNTRAFILSEDNPYFFKGALAEGIGGPHIGVPYIWPMSIIMRALTSDDEDEIRFCLKMLADTDAGTGYMHESFHRDSPEDFTRPWFAWVNSLYGELILKTAQLQPNILTN